MRAYCANLAATAHTGVSIRDLNADTDKIIDGLAKAHDVGRAYIARAILDHIANSPDVVASIVKERMGEPKPKLGRSYARKRKSEPETKPSRKQDDVCRSLLGEVPIGGCRYPYCECKI